MGLLLTGLARTGVPVIVQTRWPSHAAIPSGWLGETYLQLVPMLRAETATESARADIFLLAGDSRSWLTDDRLAAVSLLPMSPSPPNQVSTAPNALHGQHDMAAFANQYFTAMVSEFCRVNVHMLCRQYGNARKRIAFEPHRPSRRNPLWR